MSATARTGNDVYVASAALGLALIRFNATFGHDLRQPILADHVRVAAVVSEKRGRPEIAQALRIALSEVRR